jgi:hypothetical protein
MTPVAAGVTLICYNACHGMSSRWQRTFCPHSNPRHRGIKWTLFGKHSVVVVRCGQLPRACLDVAKQDLALSLHKRFSILFALAGVAWILFGGHSSDSE